MGFSVNVRTATVKDLQGLAAQGGRVRCKNGILYTVEVRRPGPFNRVNRAVEKLTGLTRTKRDLACTAVEAICRRSGMVWDGALAGSGLSNAALDKLRSRRGDLKAEHLNQALSRFVQVGDIAYEIGPVLGAGTCGEVREARNGSIRIALKSVLPPVDDSPQAAREHAVLVDNLRREAQAQAYAASQPADDVGARILAAHEVVEGHDGKAYLPMPLVRGSGERLVEEAMQASPGASAQESLDARADDLALRLSLRDWLEALELLNQAGLAHRDVKPANYLLGPDGHWRLGDFGAAGTLNSRFQATPGTPNSYLTGNDNDQLKAPEWLTNEMRNSNACFEVGHACDIFSWGVAVVYCLTGRLPFDGTPERPDQRLGGSAYGRNVLAFAASGLSFSDWYLNHSGLRIPRAWREPLNAALHPDAMQRASARQLLNARAFRSGRLDDPALREQLRTRIPA